MIKIINETPKDTPDNFAFFLSITIEPIKLIIHKIIPIIVIIPPVKKPKILTTANIKKSEHDCSFIFTEFGILSFIDWTLTDAEIF